MNELPISQILRVGVPALDKQTVFEFVDLLRSGTVFPPVEVFKEGESLWLADGNHRLAAARLTGRQTIDANVHAGTARDAQLFGLKQDGQANVDSRRRAMLALLNDSEWSQWSNRRIAAHVGVSPTSVAKYRHSLNSNDSQMSLPPVPDVIYPSVNGWGVPDLLLSKQASELRLPLMKWGAAARSARMPGVYHFYTDDYKFEALWRDPAALLTSGCYAVCEPNFSTDARMPAAAALWGIYRKRWLARYWQSQGIRVFVDLNIEREFFSLALLGVPSGWRAYSNRAYGDDFAHLIDAYDLARGHAGDEIIYLVCGGRDAVRDLCQERGWMWLPEDSARARGEYGTESQTTTQTA